MINPRTISSTARTSIYGGIAGIFAVSHAEAVAIVDAILIGGVIADYSTWFFRNILWLPRNIFYGCYDSLVNILFGWYVFSVMKIEIRSDEQSIALAFVSFLTVLGLKIGYYGVTGIMNASEDEI